MGALLLLGLVILIVVLVYNRGQRVQREMGIDPGDMPIGDAVRARYEQRRMAEQARAAGAAGGDEKLANAMATAATEMTAVWGLPRPLLIFSERRLV